MPARLADMPNLTLSVPNSTWAKLAAVARKEGVTVRVLIVSRIEEVALEAKDIAQPPEPAAA
jgi:hypothetical protein